MADNADLSNLEPNPAYGSGYFVRSWAMRRLASDRLQVMMEDSAHALTMILTHDDKLLTAVDARWIRHPISSCAGADAFLAGMVGFTLTDDVHALGLVTDARAHCTHMFDSCRLGIVHIAAGRPDRRYDAVLPDTIDGPQPVQLRIDGAVDLEIVIDRATMTVLSPDWLEGAPLMRGFASWARGRLTRDMYERLFLVQRTVFVARGRSVDMTRYHGAPAQVLGPPEGSCFASQPFRYAGATRTASSRPELTVEEAIAFGFESGG